MCLYFDPVWLYSSDLNMILLSKNIIIFSFSSYKKFIHFQSSHLAK